MQSTIEETKEYIGMWVTKDGYIRHELLANNRYDEARGNLKSAYQGSYKVKAIILIIRMLQVLLPMVNLSTASFIMLEWYYIKKNN